MSGGLTSGGAGRPAITVVVATRNRAAELCHTLGRLSRLPERPALVVVDNASTDGTAAAVRSRYPQAQLISLARNRGAWARTVGTARAASPFVAFSDDDSWWEPGSLARAAAVLASHPGLGLVTGRTLVGPEGVPDPLNRVLADSPLPSGGLPGPRVLGFLGCAAVVRRSAFLAAGGYRKLLHIGGEEELLALDLAAAGWPAAYLDDVVARHWPSEVARDAAGRRSLEARNRVLIAWLRRPLRHALAGTAALARSARDDPAAARALAGLAVTLPRALAGRRRLPAPVEAQVRALELT